MRGFEVYWKIVSKNELSVPYEVINYVATFVYIKEFLFVWIDFRQNLDFPETNSDFNSLTTVER